RTCRENAELRHDRGAGHRLQGGNGSGLARAVRRDVRERLVGAVGEDERPVVLEERAADAPGAGWRGRKVRHRSALSALHVEHDDLSRRTTGRIGYEGGEADPAAVWARAELIFLGLGQRGAQPTKVASDEIDRAETEDRK